MNNNIIPITSKGFKKINQKLKTLKYITRPKIINLIKEARKFGDLKENSEYIAAQEEQILCEKNIQNLEQQLLHSRIIDITKNTIKNKIIFGTTVTIQNTNNNSIVKYRIVGDYESNIKKKLLSINSPLAKGLIGKKKHDIITINTLMGIISYKILNIE